MKNFGIKESYITNPDAPEFDDTPFKDEYQDDVYRTARRFAYMIGATSIVDLGCGSGFKLMKYFGGFHTIGVDREPTVKFLRDTYPDRAWRLIGEPLTFSQASILICSDVIEHVANPDAILDTIAALAPALAVLSTPDRVELKLGTENGPPRNVHHVREWTHDEFVSYLSERFNVVYTERGKTILAVVGRKK